MTPRELARLGLLTALALALGYMERFIPIVQGIPGIKLGLGNMVLLYGLYLTSTKHTILLMVLKVLLSGLLYAGVQGMMFSLMGGVVSLLFMIPMRRFGGFSTVGVSIGGGVGHNVGQILVAMFLVQTKAVVSYLPILLVSGLLAGLLTGVAASRVIRALEKHGD